MYDSSGSDVKSQT